MILLLRRVSQRRRAWRNKLYTGWLVCVHSGWIVASHFQKSPPATYMTQKILSTTGRIKTWLHYIYARSGRESVCVWCRVSDIVIVYLKDPLRFSNEVFYGCGHNIVSVKYKKKYSKSTKYSIWIKSYIELFLVFLYKICWLWWI